MLIEHSHRRLNPLTGEWVLVSPHRTKRPWQGQVETVGEPAAISYDPGCYLCPGNTRAGGIRNPDYRSTFVFENDFAALRLDIPEAAWSEDELFVARSERGSCRVVCFAPNHGLTLSRMEVPAIVEVIHTWMEQLVELAANPSIRSVQIFENRGAMMGSSNPHPHCQIWASESVPNELAKEVAAQSRWQESHGACMLCRYLQRETQLRERVATENDFFLAVVPFWAVWPFETLILPKRHMASIDAMSPAESAAYAAILRDITSRYDGLFGVPFPYTMGLHQKPTDGQPHAAFHLHTHFYPPLLRSATVRKFMVGFEMLGGPQRDITPELAAERLRLTPSSC